MHSATHVGLDAGELTPIHVPTPGEDALRDLVRVREDTKDDCRKTQHRVKKLCRVLARGGALRDPRYRRDSAEPGRGQSDRRKALHGPSRGSRTTPLRQHPPSSSKGRAGEARSRRALRRPARPPTTLPSWPLDTD